MKQYIRAALLMLLIVFGAAWQIIQADTPQTQSEDVSEPVQDTVQSTSRSDAQRILRVKLGGEVVAMDMETYLIGVLRAEMPATFEIEALKAQAVAARTYTLYKMENGGSANHPDADACDDITCCKAYQTREDAFAQWGDAAQDYEDKLHRAVTETDGEVVWYDEHPVLAVFHSSSAGMTRSADKVWSSDLPYLQSVASPEGADSVPNYYSSVHFTREEMRAAIEPTYPAASFDGASDTWVQSVVYADDGSALSAVVGGVTMRAAQVRSLLGLRSACFSVSADADGVTFHVTGYGHGVGMSQYGANVMAQEGKSYREILTWYYSGTSVGVYPSAD